MNDLERVLATLARLLRGVDEPAQDPTPGPADRRRGKAASRFGGDEHSLKTGAAPGQADRGTT